MPSTTSLAQSQARANILVFVETPNAQCRDRLTQADDMSASRSIAFSENLVAWKAPGREDERVCPEIARRRKFSCPGAQEGLRCQLTMASMVFAQSLQDVSVALQPDEFIRSFSSDAKVAALCLVCTRAQLFGFLGRVLIGVRVIMPSQESVDQLHYEVGFEHGAA